MKKLLIVLACLSLTVGVASALDCMIMGTQLSNWQMSVVYDAEKGRHDYKGKVTYKVQCDDGGGLPCVACAEHELRHWEYSIILDDDDWAWIPAADAKTEISAECGTNADHDVDYTYPVQANDWYSHTVLLYGWPCNLTLEHDPIRIDSDFLIAQID